MDPRIIPEMSPADLYAREAAMKAAPGEFDVLSTELVALALDRHETAMLPEAHRIVLVGSVSVR